MGIALKVIGGLLVVGGFAIKEAALVIVGFVVFLIGFWLGSATRDYINRNK